MDNYFYTVFRVFYVGETETHFVDHFNTYDGALVKHYKNIAADLDRSGCTYQASYIVRSDGLMMEGKVFDRRPSPEPEPEPEE